MSRTRSMLAAFGLAVAFITPLSAQSATGLTTPPQGPVPTMETSMATTPAPVGLQSRSSVASTAWDDATGVTSLAARRRGEGEVLMIVGAAGIVTGILIDEGLISFAGAAVGLYGLYLHLR
jgi:hypothetical protein